MSIEEPNLKERAAINAAQPVPGSWRPYSYERRGCDTWLVKGCATLVSESGPRSGQVVFLPSKDHKTVILTGDMISKLQAQGAQ